MLPHQIGVNAFNQVLRIGQENGILWDNRSAMSYSDHVLRMPEETNMRVDKTTMSVSLENRSPFLDYKVVEYVMPLPFNKKTTFRNEKRLLKLAFGDIVPENVLKCKKDGWISPYYYWMRGLLWPEM